jgi:hypothetical protein
MEQESDNELQESTIKRNFLAPLEMAMMQ